VNPKKISPPPLLPSRRIVFASCRRVFASFRVRLFGWLLHCHAVSRRSRCPVASFRRVAMPCCAALRRHVSLSRHVVSSSRCLVSSCLVVASRPFAHLITPALFGWLLRRRAASRPCFPSRLSLLRLAIVSLAAVASRLVSSSHCVSSSRPVV
jgi:hypothetical protein